MRVARGNAPGRPPRLRGACGIGVLWLTAACGAPTPDAPPLENQDTGNQAAREVVMTPEQVRHAGIRWARVEATTTTAVVEVPGQLAPNEDRTARVSAPAPGRVTTVHVRVGDRIPSGAPLVTLQSTQGATARSEYAGAAADLQARQSAARYARMAVGRAERLLELKAMSRQEVERARVDAEEADAAQAQAEAELERARAAVAQLGVDPGTGDLVLRAPLAGIVLGRDAVPGSVVDAGAPLITVSDVTTLWLQMALPEGVASTLRPGVGVRFRVAALGTDVFEATVENIGAALDPATRTLPVHAIVRNESGALRPAMFATAEVPRAEPRAGVVVPESALQLLDTRPVVFVAIPDAQGGARFEHREVETGAKNDATVQIVRGVQAGDTVVTEGAFAVKSEFARARAPIG